MDTGPTSTHYRKRKFNILIASDSIAVRREQGIGPRLMPAKWKDLYDSIPSNDPARQPLPKPPKVNASIPLKRRNVLRVELSQSPS